jgi:hypothetical protein
MDCADIQIFASNRLFPRAVVNGLNDERKYQPIRLGRGLWNKIRRRTTSWERNNVHAGEIGPQTLVHEWGHYALGLKDQYLELNRRKYVLPVLSPILNTIMADVTITEFLGARVPTKNPDLPSLVSTALSSHRASDNNEWRLLSMHPRYKSLHISSRHSPEPQAPDLRPIPVFYRVTQQASPPLQLYWRNIAFEMRAMNDEHCWVYILKGSEIAKPTALIAQGVYEKLDQAPGGFPLLGAELGDFIVLIGNDLHAKTFTPLVLWARIISHDSTAWEWHPATPSSFPIVDVTVNQVVRQSPPRYSIQLDIEGYGTRWMPWIFPLGEQQGRQDVRIDDQRALDGHVLLVASNGEIGPQLAIVNYSIGGSPGDSGFPVGPNPLPAGSADGNAMLFFWDDSKKKVDYGTLYPTRSSTEIDEMYERFRIVTVTNLSNEAPVVAADRGPDWTPCSYAFSLTSNESFAPLVDAKSERDLHPTLVLYYDQQTREDDSDQLAIGRYNRDLGQWEILDADKIYEDRDRYLIALLLNSSTAPNLFAGEGGAERYRIFMQPSSLLTRSLPANATTNVQQATVAR